MIILKWLSLKRKMIELIIVNSQHLKIQIRKIKDFLWDS